MKASIFAVLATVLMAGCATQQPTVWNKDGGTQEQFSRDQLTCRQYAMQAAQTMGLSGNLFVGIAISRDMNDCMRSLGYYEMRR